jgi:F0F1-type ATP synthase assembly protein I
MIVVVIVSGILLGWGIGNYLLDRYINENNEDINESQN